MLPHSLFPIAIGTPAHGRAGEVESPSGSRNQKSLPLRGRDLGRGTSSRKLNSLGRDSEI